MPGAIKTYAILFSVLLFGLMGCSDKVTEPSAASDASAKASVKESVPSPQKLVSATNRVTLAESFPGATSNELAHLKACFDALDDGHDAFAMRHARELMDSTNADVRLQAVEAFGWIGRFAVKELAEMMADADEEVRSEALRRWEMAFDEISSEVSKLQEIERAVLMLKDQSSLDAVMMKLAVVEDYNAVRLLSGIITSTNVSAVAAEVAREEYASLAEEPFSDAKRAEQVEKMLKDQADGLVPIPPKGQPSKAQQRKGTK